MNEEIAELHGIESADEDYEPPSKQVRMSSIQKTPITILTELCAQKKAKPVFTDLPQEDKVFVIKVEVLGKSAIGRGQTKKIAKHNSADRILAKINSNDILDDDDDTAQQGYASDYVSKLLDLCVQRNFHKPELTEVEHYGPSHSPVFIYQCKLDSIVKTASDSSKIAAKQKAAKEVYDILRDCFPDIEKKVAKIDDTQVKDMVYDRISTYLEMRNQEKTASMGCAIADRHKFLVNYKKDKEGCFVQNLKDILRQEVSDDEKYESLKEELEKMWQCEVYKFDACQNDMWIFEVVIDYDQFTIVIPAVESELKRKVLKYFSDILQISCLPENHVTPRPVEKITLLPLFN